MAAVPSVSKVTMHYILLLHYTDQCGLAFIPTRLDARTQVLLRNLMFSTPTEWDGPGYIYALELQGMSA